MLQPIITYTHCPDLASAKKVAQQLIEQQLAACVNIMPNVESIYPWQGQIEQSSEFKLEIKTVLELAHRVEQSIKDNHPYQVPDITAVEMAAISEDYYAWMAENLKVDETES